MVVDAHGDELDEAFPGIDAGVQGLMAEVEEAFWASRRCRRSRMAVSAGPELGDKAGSIRQRVVLLLARTG